MKNPLGHLNATAPANLARSVLFHVRPNVEKISVSNGYLGLCCYLDWRTSLSFARGARIRFKDEGFLVLGTERSSFRGWAGRNSLFLEEEGVIEVRGFNQIGRGSLLWVLGGGRIQLDGCSTSGKNMIIAKEYVEIGEGTQIAWGVTISDHDFHKTYTGGVQNVETAPVRIGKNAWIGMDARVLKGVEIGAGAIVAAGSIVTRSVPPHALVAGVPARIIRRDVEFFG